MNVLVLYTLYARPIKYVSHNLHAFRIFAAVAFILCRYFRTLAPFFLYSASAEIQLSAKLTKQDRLFGNHHYENMLSQKVQIVFLLTVLKFIDATINTRFSFALFLKLDNLIHPWDQ